LNQPDAADARATLERLIDLLKTLVSTGLADDAERRRLSKGVGRAGAQLDGAAQVVSQAILMCAASGFRYWARTAEIWSQAVPLIVAALADGDSQLGRDQATSAAPVDELRRALRDLADVPADEARRLQQALERLFFRLGPATTTGTPDAENYWRRWDAKP
jgi:hypothetical protein